MKLRQPILFLLASSLCGCVATQSDVLDLSQQTDDLKSQVTDLKKTITTMQANQADLTVQIKQLHEDLTANSEVVKESMGNMDRLSTKLDTMAAQLAGKVTQLGATITAAQEKNMEVQQKAIEAQARETNATELLLSSEKRLQAHDYALAAIGLEDYLKKFPGGDMTDVATYDLGLAYYGQKNWSKAGRQFALLLEKYPQSGQTPGARLHYALCLINLRKGFDEAKSFLESIISDYPKSPEASEATAALKKLSSRSKSKKAQ